MKKNKVKTIYVCNNCGANYPTWLGRCNECGSYNTIVEEIKEENKNNFTTSSNIITLEPITKIKKNIFLDRRKTGFSSLDNAFGGGLVDGQVVLISGEPGIGKSTLLLQFSSYFAEKEKVLYISAEESQQQVYMRAERLNAIKNNLYVLSETKCENILSAIEILNPSLIVLDSIQTVYSENLESAAGSVSQVKYVSSKITKISKSKGIISIIVGQITKEGNIAGPKVLEHIVDTVAQFEGERGYGYRILKILKNRFGSSGEIAVFSMTDKGMEEVLEPSAFFLSEKPKNEPGSVIFPYAEGSKPILVEVQALVSKTFFPVPQRKSQGIDLNKLAILTAVIEKELKINLRDKDIFINVVGGINIDEPAVDLALATAIYSSYTNKPLDNLAVFGEIGLTGEVRSVHFLDLRIKECKRFGIVNIICPNFDRSDTIGIKKLNQIREIIK